MNTYSCWGAQIPLKGRLVSSFEEVRTAPIDFDGFPNIFPDYSNKCIYTKQVNLDGTISIQRYDLHTPPPAAETPTFITKEEFDKAIAELRQSLIPPPASATKKDETVKMF